MTVIVKPEVKSTLRTINLVLSRKEGSVQVKQGYVLGNIHHALLKNYLG